MNIQEFAGRDAISVQELDELRRARRAHLVLDVREAEELEICRLEGALHIPMGQVAARIGELPRDSPVVVMCHHGGRSSMIVGLLRRAGLDNAVNLDGGIDAWARQVDDSLRLY
jgi:rhodanese-related sulfurtransferase